MKNVMSMFLLCFLVSGCSLLPFSGNKQSSQVSLIKSQSDEKYQTAVEVAGKPVILDYHKKTFDINRVSEEKELNVWQKFCRWLGNLSILAVLVVAGGLFAGTTGPLMWFIGRYHTFRKTVKQVVDSVEKSKAIQRDVELKNTLSATLDNDAKMLIDDIKRGAGK